MTVAYLKQGEYVATLRQTRELGASLLVALASSDQKKAFLSASLARKGLAAVSDKYTKQVEALWEAANKEALHHLSLVMQNNPKKSVDTILRRLDVQSALRQPYEEAAKASEDILRKAWEAGEAEALKKVKGEFKLLGEDWKGHELDEALLDSLVGDLHANAKAMRQRYREALTKDSTSSVKQRLTILTNDAKTRARYSVSTAVWGVSTQVRESAIDKAGLNKMWVAVLDSHTCTHCANLHGTILKPGEQFSKTAGASKLKVYMGKLLGPPRHPNCRCILVPTLLKPKKPKN